MGYLKLTVASLAGEIRHWGAHGAVHPRRGVHLQPLHESEVRVLWSPSPEPHLLPSARAFPGSLAGCVPGPWGQGCRHGPGGLGSAGHCGVGGFLPPVVLEGPGATAGSNRTAAPEVPGQQLCAGWLAAHTCLSPAGRRRCSSTRARRTRWPPCEPSAGRRTSSRCRPTEAGRAGRRLTQISDRASDCAIKCCDAYL